MGKLQRGLDDRLILWVRQLAWWHATPKPDPSSRRGKAEPDASQPSRIEVAKGRKTGAQMPPNPAQHLTDWLVEIGLTESAGMGAGPISWRTIAAWRDVVGVTIEPWEARLLRRLSVAYLAEGRAAESEHCPPPWRWKLTAEERQADDAALRAVLD